MRHILWCIKLKGIYKPEWGGGGYTGGINTGGGGGSGRPESLWKVWEDKSEYILCLHSEAQGSSHSSYLISWLISNVSLLLFNWIYA